MVVLVDQMDQPVGTMEKMEAHRKGVLHRAFSVFIVNEKGEMLLQRRAKTKYHSPGLWTNACCSHQQPGESNTEAAERRLMEELGIHLTAKDLFNFTYKADVGGGLIEHEYDHVMIAEYNGPFDLNPDEVDAVQYVSTAWLEKDLKANPHEYTEWFKICFDQFVAHIH